jgi:hypothetical protein
MITLPPLNPVCLRSFSVLIGAFGALLISAFLFFSGTHSPSTLGVASGFVLSFPGLLWPKVMCWPYRAWNKLALELARWSGLILMAISFYIVLVAVGRAGSSLKLNQSDSDESLWIPRQTLVPKAYQAQYPNSARPPLETGFVFPFISWAVRSGNFWACFLFPFIWLFSALDARPENDLPGDIYTLF